MEKNSLSPSTLKTEEGLYHVKTEHTSPQKRYKIMRGHIPYGQECLVKQSPSELAVQQQKHPN